jgi:predicted nucleic acid-binding protein
MAWLQNEKGAQTVENLLGSAKRTGEKLLLHEVNLAEVYYLTIRRAGEERAKSLGAQLLTLPIELIATTPGILWQTAALKTRHRVSLADAFAAATAIELNATVITGDPEFKPLGHLVEIVWL